MKLIFAGTPVFAEHALKRLIENNFGVVLVLTQPDRPAGRGMKLAPSSVKQFALSHNLEVFQPQTLRRAEVEAKLKATKADVMVVAAYGLIIPASILTMPKYGCINIHASVLPRWRGAAPIQRALLAGDTTSGITIMQMDEGLDTGAILTQQNMPINERETAATLHDKLAELGSEMIVSTLKKLQHTMLSQIDQPKTGVTYAAKINKDESVINWAQSNIEIDRLIRAFNPVPGAVTNYRDTQVKIWQARLVAGTIGKPGQIMEMNKEIIIACGEGCLGVEILQRSGGKKISAQDFCSGVGLKAGEFFGNKT